MFLPITGLTNIPATGFQDIDNIHIIIAPGGDPPRLPTAHTCTNMINIPYYSDKETMYQNLKKAIIWICLILI